MKHMKEWRVKLYAADRYQTSDGSWRSGYVLKGTFWANVKPVSVAANYANSGIYELAEFIFTVNKPSSFELAPDLYAIWGDRVLKATKVEDVEGKSRGDVKLYMKADGSISVSNFLSKVTA